MRKNKKKKVLAWSELKLDRVFFSYFWRGWRWVDGVQWRITCHEHVTLDNGNNFLINQDYLKRFISWTTALESDICFFLVWYSA